MSLSSVSPLLSVPQAQPLMDLMQAGPGAGTRQLSDALRPGHALTQKALGTLMNGIDPLRLNLSEGERAALQMHVSQFHAMVTLAMNVSLGLGKACEKLQQG